MGAMFRNDDADVGTVRREVNLRQAFPSGGSRASHISGSAAADSNLSHSSAIATPPQLLIVSSACKECLSSCDLISAPKTSNKIGRRQRGALSAANHCASSV
jgi:hypothetical protein